MGDLAPLIPIIAILTAGGVIALFALKPFGNRILDLLEESNRARQASLHEDQELRRLHERLDLVAERQDFLEALLEERSDRQLRKPEGREE